MPMMRRGPLDRYPVETVLREASAHEVSGGVEFHSEAPATFYFTNGRIYAASPGVDLGPGPDTPATDEITARRLAVDLLAASLGSTTGWYYHDPLTRHRCIGEWDWDTASLIMASRAQRAAEAEPEILPPPPAAPEAPETPAPPEPDRPVQLQDVAASAVVLGPDAWSLVVALASPSTADALAEQLGWDRARVDAALNEFTRRGVLSESDQPTEEPVPPVSPITVPAGALGKSGNGRQSEPRTPPPATEPTAAQGRGRKRRQR